MCLFITLGLYFLFCLLLLLLCFNHILYMYITVNFYANSEYADQLPRIAASDQDLSCLPLSLLCGSRHNGLTDRHANTKYTCGLH